MISGVTALQTCLQRHKLQKNDPLEKAVKMAKNQPGNILSWPRYVIIAIGDILMSNKKKIQLLTLRELVALKAAVSASDIFLHSNYIWIQRALSQQLRSPTWGASLKSLLSVVPKWIRASAPSRGKRGREGEGGRDEGRRQREWGIKTYKRVKNNEWILKWVFKCWE